MQRFSKSVGIQCQKDFYKCFAHAEEAYDSISVKAYRNDEWKGQFSEWSYSEPLAISILS